MIKKNNTLIFALILAISGIGILVFYAVSGGGYRDYTERTTGTLTSVVQTYFATDTDETDEFEGTVTYKIGEKEYRIENFSLNKLYEDGAQIELAFAPDKPEKAVAASNVENSWVMIPCGVACILASAVLVFKRIHGKA